MPQDLEDLLPALLLDWIAVLDFTKAGEPHYHVVAALSEEISTEVQRAVRRLRSAIERLRQRGSDGQTLWRTVTEGRRAFYEKLRELEVLNPTLRRFRSHLEVVLRYSAFGFQHALSPIASAEGTAAYLGRRVHQWVRRRDGRHRNAKSLVSRSPETLTIPRQYKAVPPGSWPCACRP